MKRKEGSLMEAADGSLLALVNEIVASAIARRSQVVRILPASGKSFRIFEGRGDNELRKTASIPANLQRSVVSRFKIMTNLKIATHKAAQSGTFEFHIGGNSGHPKRITLFCLPSIKDDQEELVLIL